MQFLFPPLYCPVQIKEDDPLPGCVVSALKVVFNHCLRLLTCNKRTDHASIAGMLEDVGSTSASSVNQLAAETRLIEAWKSFHIENYCMKEVLKPRYKGNYRTRSNHVDFLELGVDDIHGSAGFVQTTARLWKDSPMSVKEATTISLAKKEIRRIVRDKIPI